MNCPLPGENRLDKPDFVKKIRFAIEGLFRNAKIIKKQGLKPPL
jgi:hypothetical protein